MTTIGSFILVKGEAQWIGPHLATSLPHLDQMVFYDGGSTDGTIEIIEKFQKLHPDGNKIKLVKDKDPKDLRDDYVRVFNECLHALDTDLAFFLHPDQIIVDPGNIRNLGDGIAYSTSMRSFGGEPGGQLYEVKTGRADAWLNIFRLKNPDLGAHYHGHYGAANESVYFKQITGDAHDYHGLHFGNYPYPVIDSGIKLLHFSDVRPLARRIGRMQTCLLNQGHKVFDAERIAQIHPRVTLKNGGEFTFEPAEYPEIFKTWESALQVPA